jgi:hypothetical protein
MAKEHREPLDYFALIERQFEQKLAEYGRMFTAKNRSDDQEQP